MNPLETIVKALPASWQPKAKSIIAAVVAALTIVSVAVPEVPDWVTIVLACLTVGGVYGTTAPGYVGPAVAKGTVTEKDTPQ